MGPEILQYYSRKMECERNLDATTSDITSSTLNTLLKNMPTLTEKTAAETSNPAYNIPDSRNPANHTSIEEEKDKLITVRMETASEYKQDLSVDEDSKEFQSALKRARNRYNFDEGDDRVLCCCGSDTVDLDSSRREVYESDSSEYGDDDESSSWSNDEWSETDYSSYEDDEEFEEEDDEEFEEENGDPGKRDGAEYVDYSYLIAEADDEHEDSNDEDDADYSPGESDDDDEEESEED